MTPFETRYPGYRSNVRDRLAVKLANLVLRLSTRRYRDLLAAVIDAGLAVGRDR